MSFGTVQAEKMTTESGYSLGAGNASSFKNRIINGNMVISQYNATSSVTPSATATNVYVIDRFFYFQSLASKFNLQQLSASPPTGFNNYLGATVASSVSVGVNDYFGIGQIIEGFNSADLGWGTANAKTVTLSFQVYSSLTGTFGGAIQNAAQTRSYPFTYSISTANTWTSISVTVAGDTGGTWVGASNAGCIRVNFSLGMGSSFSGTANAWASANSMSVTGAVSVVGTASAYLYITGVQLEVGTVATSFDYRSIGTELALCQRYFQKIAAITTGSGYDNFAIATSYASGATSFRFVIPLSTVMRAAPSFSQNGSFVALGVVSGTLTGLGLADQGGNPIVGMGFTSPNAGSAGQTIIIRANNDTTAALLYSAEL
jgi:hypothetical protein